MQKFNAIIENLAILVGPIIDKLHSVVDRILGWHKLLGLLFIPIAMVTAALTGFVIRGIGSLLGKRKIFSTALKIMTGDFKALKKELDDCLLYTSPSPRD